MDSPGGTSKTFPNNLLLAKVSKRNEIVLFVDSPGITANLFIRGKTAHSAFKLTIVIASTENSTCNISRNSGIAKILKECKIIVWNE